MKLTFKSYTLHLKHQFTLAQSSRSTTPVVLTKIEYENYVGYGEASMPPYLGESHETVIKFLSKVDLKQFKDPFQLADILNYVDKIAPKNSAAKASVDIALHDLLGKIMNRAWYQIWGFTKEKTPLTTYTIGIDSEEVIREKVKEAAPYKILKVKLGRDNDKEIVKVIRSVTDKPIAVDINQGWKDREQALDLIYWLKEQNTLFIEQPMPKDLIDDLAWLTSKSPLPIIADEGVQGIADVVKAKDIYHGINIKLMKCGGMRNAREMLSIARALGMQVMLGCMTETSCAVSAAAQLAAAVDFADLDGNLLISNDPFDGLEVVKGKALANNEPGIGVDLIDENFFD
ncbi:MAG: dipeptide epimerase [Bacteroidales bacterium]|nr:dipeptide epimerase [Bacteroidales bacterium]